MLTIFETFNLKHGMTLLFLNIYIRYFEPPIKNVDILYNENFYLLNMILYYFSTKVYMFKKTN